MDVLKMLAELRQERTQIVEAIIALERLALGRGKRRGRPPPWMTAVSALRQSGRPPKNPLMVAAPAVAPAPARKRRSRSAAQRKAQAERMKAYWAAKRKKQARK